MTTVISWTETSNDGCCLSVVLFLKSLDWDMLKHTNPKRKRGSPFRSSLTLRIGPYTSEVVG